MLYEFKDIQQALTTPLRLQASIIRHSMNSPLNPLKDLPLTRTIAANAEMIERMTRRFGKPSFALQKTKINGRNACVSDDIIAQKPFCDLIHFKRNIKRNDPNVLVVAPMSGHYATLLRGTVEALLPHHNVYITDWLDARQIPQEEGRFDLDTYILYLREFMAMLGPQTHVIAVCQPAVPVLAAISLMASENDPNQPLTMTLMGGPIDTRISPTAVTQLAETRTISWFEDMAVHNVPYYYAGSGRKVYPGFLQLGGFMSMNLDKHVGSYMNHYKHLIQGDGESAEKHREFYNEYLAVMDIPAEFYLQTVETVFMRQALPRGRMEWKDDTTGQTLPVRPQDIKRTALLTIEGERDDISARGQTTAAHTLCENLAPSKQFHHLEPETGHYGIFNGRKYRDNIMPRIRHFIRQHDEKADPVPETDLASTPDIKPQRYNKEKHSYTSDAGAPQ